MARAIFVCEITENAIRLPIRWRPLPMKNCLSGWSFVWELEVDGSGAEHDEGGVGGVESVGAPDDEADLGVEPSDAAVGDAVLDRVEDHVAALTMVFAALTNGASLERKRTTSVRSSTGTPARNVTSACGPADRYRAPERLCPVTSSNRTPANVLRLAAGGGLRFGGITVSYARAGFMRRKRRSWSSTCSAVAVSLLSIRLVVP